ncbi:MAG: CBS domain-containing protein, partial [Candidatus Cloacimonetes bacterium]|nr:CBS domain-containing protein [Candidatus Cloacimonadota bacterium]
LAILLLEDKGFSLEDFARFHPGGNIGKKLLIKVRDLMHTGDELPLIGEEAAMSEAILEMTSKKLGCVAVVDKDKHLTGIITDGDLRRQIQQKKDKLLQHKVQECMTLQPRYGHPDQLAAEALKLMEDHKITMLPIVDNKNNLVGMLHMHDLIEAGIL